jgi:hypothetical protein
MRLYNEYLEAEVLEPGGPTAIDVIRVRYLVAPLGIFTMATPQRGKNLKFWT